MGLFERSVSESSDDIDIRPLEFGDLKRRLSESADEPPPSYNEGSNLFFSSAYRQKRKKGFSMPSPKVTNAWKKAASKALSKENPWCKFHLEECRTEKARRHRFNAFEKEWLEDEVLVKVETNPFSNGAMRECFRMKKLSNFIKADDWMKAQNYVAKRYMNADTKRNTYFEDVKLQMDAKIWGEDFNVHNPPKKVDIFQMAVLEFFEREGKPLYHVEHFIEGHYQKYNSNTGFVNLSSENITRMTPQAFSHFTFERSGHELIVVDIQGVGDLYTDPQIHTVAGDNYGDGNLGTRGMALFFHSHECNDICRKLKLSPFDLADSEKGIMRKRRLRLTSSTQVRGNEEAVVPFDKKRTQSLSSGYLSTEERDRIDTISPAESMESVGSYDDNCLPPKDDSGLKCPEMRRCRLRYDSTSEIWEDSECREDAMRNLKETNDRKARPSRIIEEQDHSLILEQLRENKMENSNKELQAVLGKIHLDLAKYHELNRFVNENESYDREAAMFHLEKAAKCGNLSSILTMAEIHTGLPHDVLPDIELDDNQRQLSVGFNYLYMAAQFKFRAAMIKVAKAFDTGLGLPSEKSVDWKEAIKWYEFAVNSYNDCEESTSDEKEFDSAMDDPIYQLQARQAQLYQEGGNGLDKDPLKAGELFSSAADLATESMKGKLASKYYMQAEEAWAEIEE